ncbi:uncharacterized protein A4U43_C05F9240 [Asparagus officinalis]|uniref:Uncharacterized protein n=1 Tax=Asparagus officinalis TaxID=4686 RepID=A0A5P1EQE7_ASPOF|nr:uncharacterized protein A4U43_C05F9240 [Asparagus officinalis]
MVAHLDWLSPNSAAWTAKIEPAIATLPREPMSSSITGRLPSLEELESYALEQWEDNSVLSPWGRPVFLVATHKLSSSREVNEFLVLYATSFSARIEYQLPNLIAGSITKESVDNAFEKGITLPNLIAGSITKESVDNAFEKGITSEQCWLKKQKDVLFPALQETGENVIWTSRLIFGKGEKNNMDIPRIASFGVAIHPEPFLVLKAEQIRGDIKT